MLDSNLLEGEVRNVCSFPSVLDRNPTDVTVSIEVQERVLVEITRLGYFRGPELDMQGVGVLKVADFHG